MGQKGQCPTVQTFDSFAPWQFAPFAPSWQFAQFAVAKGYDSLRLYRNSFKFPNYRNKAQHMGQIVELKK